MYKVITELLAMVHGITMFVWTLKKGWSIWTYKIKWRLTKHKESKY